MGLPHIDIDEVRASSYQSNVQAGQFIRVTNSLIDLISGTMDTKDTFGAATVTAIDTVTAAPLTLYDVDFGGGVTGVAYGCRFAGAAVPVVGDGVWVVTNGAASLVVGAVG